MFVSARREAKIKSRSEELNDDKLTLRLSPESLPLKYTLAEIYDECFSINDPENLKDKLEISIILNACLNSVERLCKKESRNEIIRKLLFRVSKLILPNGNIIFSNNLTDAEKQRALCQTRHIASFGLSALVHLLDLQDKLQEIKIDEQVITNILVFTSISDPWTTQVGLKCTEHLLSTLLTQVSLSEFIGSFILSSFIRPLFSASKPKTITTSGRAAIPVDTPQKSHDFEASDLASKPWRLDNCYAIRILSWAIINASQDIILASFHLIIPPLLIILDYPSSSIQLVGLEMLNTFIQKMTPKVLEQTGLGAVIEDAIHPILLYLPPITPITETISLLPTAYKVIFTLLEIRFPSTFLDLSNQNQAIQKRKLSCLSRIFRQAILPAHNHSSSSSMTDPRIQQVILDQLPPLIRAFGMHTTANLYALLPMIADVILDPFATASLSTILAAIKALKEVILCAWPRIGEENRRREVIRMIVGCWARVRHENVNSRENCQVAVLEELRIVGELFMKAVEASSDVDLGSELKPLLDVDGSLMEVFKIQIEG